MNAPRLVLVIPCYNEEAVLPLSLPQLITCLDNWVQRGWISPDSRLLFVDDGSTDGTWSLLSAAHQAHPAVWAIRLSRNRGHQNALWAGLASAAKTADAVISLDVDLQDDLGAMTEMIRSYREGYDVVYGVRRSRQTDALLKRGTARLFYRLQQKLGAQIVYDHADFRLLSKRALKALLAYSEVNLYVRGLVPLIGFPSTQVLYDRHPRAAGESKYPLRAMLRLAGNGLLDYSSRLLNWIAPLGVILLLGGLVSSAVLAIKALIGSAFSQLWGLSAWITSLFGVTLLALGLMAQYVGRISLEVKRRPRYFISEQLMQPDHLMQSDPLMQPDRPAQPQAHDGEASSCA